VQDCRDGTVITFTATITVDRATPVTYHWERSDGAIDTNQHPSLVYPGPGSQSVTTQWHRWGVSGDRLTGAETLVTDSPATARGTAAFTVTCT
jgi:hypothetical protein